jgi:RNase P subunit RPR2
MTDEQSWTTLNVTMNDFDTLFRPFLAIKDSGSMRDDKRAIDDVVQLMRCYDCENLTGGPGLRVRPTDPNEDWNMVCPDCQHKRRIKQHFDRILREREWD